MPRRQSGAAGGQPERLHHAARIGNLQPQDVLVGKSPVAQPRYPLGAMYAQYVFVRRRQRLYQVFRRSEVSAQEAVAQPLVFLGRENVVPQMKVVPLGVNQRKREHGIILAPIVAP